MRIRDATISDIESLPRVEAAITPARRPPIPRDTDRDITLRLAEEEVARRDRRGA